MVNSFSFRIKFFLVLPQIKTLNIAISPCPNDIFIFAGLLLNKIAHSFALEWSIQSLHHLNRLAQTNTMDVVKVSMASYKSLQSRYRLLAVGAAFAQDKGPTIVSASCTPYASNRILLVPGKGSTADYLVKQLLGHKSIQYCDFKEIVPLLLQHPDWMGVVIHESGGCLTQYDLHVLLDLSKQWYETTAMLLPLGGLILKNTRSLELDHQLCDLIRQSIDYAKQHPDEVTPLLLQYSQEKDPKILWSHIHNYVTKDTYCLSDKARQSVAYFTS